MLALSRPRTCRKPYSGSLLLLIHRGVVGARSFERRVQPVHRRAHELCDRDLVHQQRVAFLPDLVLLLERVVVVLNLLLRMYGGGLRSFWITWSTSGERTPACCEHF